MNFENFVAELLIHAPHVSARDAVSFFERIKQDVESARRAAALPRLIEVSREDAEIKRLINNKQRIAAIKRLRILTGEMSLVVLKDAIDGAYPWSVPQPAF